MGYRETSKGKDSKQKTKQWILPIELSSQTREGRLTGGLVTVMEDKGTWEVDIPIYVCE